MRRALPLLAVLTLPLAGGAQEPGVRLHRNLPASYPFGSLPRGVVVPPMNREAMRAASADGGWSESRRPADEVLRPQEAWAPSTRELDANTRSPAGTQLRYREVFTPSVSPFKRTQSFDAVDAQGRLFVRNPVLRPLTVGPSGLTGPTQRFTGDANLELSPDNPTALPSVAAESFVVGYRTSPQVSVAFFQDSAGNLFVRGERVATVRLSWVLEAPERMFVPAAVPAVPLSEVAPRLGVAAPAVPAFLGADAPAVVTHFGLTARGDLASTLARLTERFRAFRDADLPAPPNASLYRALATGGVGACRHRAYAFALTLMALGVPARFVGNEAHAWAEVQLPENGWTRIDLGGWDVPLREQGHDARPAFVPRQPDPFPRPPEYTNGYSTRGAAAPEGHAPAPSPAPSPPTAPAMAAAPVDDPVESSSSGSSGAASPGARGAARVVPGAAGGATSRGGDPSAEATAAPRETPSAAEAPVRARTLLRLDEVTAQGRAGERQRFVRGTLVRCAGSATDDEQRPVADLAVQVELLRDGAPVTIERNGRRSAALGSTTTGPDGRFDAQVLLPVELGAGSYELRVRTPGDARHLPARSE